MPDFHLQTLLDRQGFAAWYKKVSAGRYHLDPWEAFDAAIAASPRCSGDLRPITELFLRRGAVQASDVRLALGNLATSALISQGVLQPRRGGKLESRLCLLSCFGLYLLIEWPVRTPSGRLIASKTYLSRGSYDCASEIVKRSPEGRTLDLGSGSGLIAMLLAKSSSQAFGIDIDKIAIRLSRLNLELNELKAKIIEADMGQWISPRRKFDFICVNPPWRIAPRRIKYPNRVARVGRGADGLDQVIRTLKTLPHLLAIGGEALMRFDLPIGAPRAQLVLNETDRFLGSHCECTFSVLGSVTSRRQAAISADTCAHLNDESQDLEGAFLKHYESLSVNEVRQVRCHIKRRS